ncbi:hypothetical protein D0C36_13220 [Mucilaginibacter conchicola]|uniref:Uncharacterized protein n=1 Tax=Mucilaginibacter conchicola TaxID=2303333 RepID=A0A372NT05_9SPHI|nr:hypothetical protein [Mucilaginibacter conchicola]RFZ92385.1 hypothetical protein D0C36_13220 [Mucilaginibacter conchicola]
MKLISPKLHGIIDYMLVIFLFLSPVVFSMTSETSSQVYTIAVVQMLLTIITNYSYGMFRAIPLKLHGVIELALSVGMVVAAFTVLQYDERAKGYYTGLGIFWFIIVVFSDYNKDRDGIKAPIL